MDVDKDLIDILQSPTVKPEAKLQGWEYVLGLTVTKEGLTRLVSSGYISFIADYIKQDNLDAHSLNLALKCLINISSSAEGTSAVLSVSKDTILFLLNSIQDSYCAFVEQACYLLSNISTHHNICKDDSVMVKFPEILKQLFDGFFSLESNSRERYKFLTLVVANISRQPEGRRLLVEDDSFLRSLVLCQSPEEPDIKRLGAALTFRNCCFETNIHEKLLKELDVLPFILLPLMGPEEFEEEVMESFPVECQYLDTSKKRERLTQIRKCHVHALSLLCYTEEGWNYLKSKGVYFMARELHMWEKDVDMLEAIETLITYLMVLQYKPPNPEAVEGEGFVIPAETDVSKDIPDFII